jgi:hypothetical protein
MRPGGWAVAPRGWGAGRMAGGLGRWAQGRWDGGYMEDSGGSGRIGDRRGCWRTAIRFGSGASWFHLISFHPSYKRVTIVSCG